MQCSLQDLLVSENPKLLMVCYRNRKFFYFSKLPSYSRKIQSPKSILLMMCSVLLSLQRVFDYRQNTELFFIFS
jgi:hypothetical protein